MSKHTKDMKRIANSLEAIQRGNTARDTSRPNKDPLPLLGAVTMWLGGSESRQRKHIELCRSFPIRAKVGPNGGGKSLAVVAELLPSLDAGRKVLSTVRLIDHRTGDTHPGYEQFYDMDQLIDARHVDVFGDEVTGIANSRSASSMSPRVQNRLVQMRRDDNVFIWTAPNWARADKIIREVTQAVTECRGYYPDVAQLSESGIGQWAPKRVFNFRTYDTIEFEEWSAGKRDKIPALGSTWFKGPGSRAFSSYDTMDAVSMVGHAAESGLCDACDLPVHKTYCKGHGPAKSVELHTISESAPSLEEALELADLSHHVGSPLLVTVDDGSIVV